MGVVRGVGVAGRAESHPSGAVDVCWGWQMSCLNALGYPGSCSIHLAEDM